MRAFVWTARPVLPDERWLAIAPLLAPPRLRPKGGRRLIESRAPFFGITVRSGLRSALGDAAARDELLLRDAHGRTIMSAGQLCNIGDVDAGLLIRLELRQLQGAQLLSAEHDWLLHHDLTARQLHELRLRLKLKVLKRANGLSLHRSSRAVTWLEWLSTGVLVHLEVTHVYILRLRD